MNCSKNDHVKIVPGYSLPALVLDFILWLLLLPAMRMRVWRGRDKSLETSKGYTPKSRQNRILPQYTKTGRTKKLSYRLLGTYKSTWIYIFMVPFMIFLIIKSSLITIYTNHGNAKSWNWNKMETVMDTTYFMDDTMHHFLMIKENP